MDGERPSEKGLIAEEKERILVADDEEALRFRGLKA
jgi:hypothetical protein